MPERLLRPIRELPPGPDEVESYPASEPGAGNREATHEKWVLRRQLQSRRNRFFGTLGKSPDPQTVADRCYETLSDSARSLAASFADTGFADTDVVDYDQANWTFMGEFPIVTGGKDRLWMASAEFRVNCPRTSRGVKVRAAAYWTEGTQGCDSPTASVLKIGPLF